MRTHLAQICCALLATTTLVASSAAIDCPTGKCPLAPPVRSPGLAVDARPIARIENTTSTGRTYGSGTLIDVDGQRGLVVTCAHLFREGTGSILVTFPAGAPCTARLAKIDPEADLAALAITAPSLEPVPIATTFPQHGDPLVSCGYGSDGRLWCNQGQALGYVTTLGSHGRETLELSGTARQGDSGGPVLDGHGQLVGVLFGTNGRVVDATFCGRVRQFLARLSPRFRGSAESAPNDGSQVPPQLEQVPPREARPVRVPRRVQRPASNPLDQVVDGLGTAAEPWLSAKLAALLVSLGVPGGIAGVAGGAMVWLVMRRGKRKLRAQLDRLQGGSSSQARAGGEPASAESALVVRHHNRYVAYEINSLDRAWAAAHARVGEKYPGAIPYLKIVEGVKDQLLSGIEDPQVS